MTAASPDTLVHRLAGDFTSAYGTVPRVFSAPGRVNLIGEHTDYNDGFVLPMAIERRTWVAGALRADGRVRCRSLLFDGEIVFAADAALRPADDWANHIRGVVAGLLRQGTAVRGADLLIASDVPIGAGLSSSAALEVAVGYALASLAGVRLEMAVLARIAQRAEHEYAGTRCGLMDQLIACLGKADHALALDCRSLEHEHVPLDGKAARLVVCNTMVKHDLAAGEYNRRRAECEEAVRVLRVFYPHAAALRDVTTAALAAHASALREPILRRARHVVTENARTIEAGVALRAGDMPRIGRLMGESHASLRDDYEVSCRELDLLVTLASAQDGVFGSRMTGGGFGGCTVSLVRPDCVEGFRESVSRGYAAATGITPEVYVTTAADGVREENA